MKKHRELTDEEILNIKAEVYLREIEKREIENYDEHLFMKLNSDHPDAWKYKKFFLLKVEDEKEIFCFENSDVERLNGFDFSFELKKENLSFLSEEYEQKEEKAYLIDVEEAIEEAMRDEETGDECFNVNCRII